MRGGLIPGPSPEECAELLDLLEVGIRGAGGSLGSEPLSRFHVGDVDLQGLSSVGRLIERMDASNSRWWGLPVDHYDVSYVVYGPGGFLPLHHDWDDEDRYGPSGVGHMYVASTLLSSPTDYRGGNLVLAATPQQPEMTVPRRTGATALVHGLVDHEVTPVTGGVRVALIVSGVFGPSTTAARQRGCPDEWLQACIR